MQAFCTAAHSEGLDAQLFRPPRGEYLAIANSFANPNPVASHRHRDGFDRTPTCAGREKDRFTEEIFSSRTISRGLGGSPPPSHRPEASQAEPGAQADRDRAREL